MKRQLYYIPILIILFCHLAGCSHQSINEKISGTLQISIPKNAITEYEDTHGGFHGDGHTFAKIEFDPPEAKIITKALARHTGWHRFPLSENLKLIMYGGEKDGMEYSYGFAEKLEIPHLGKGYWFFTDRHSKSVCPGNDTQLFERGSFNFTLAIYDTATNILYYFKYDT